MSRTVDLTTPTHSSRPHGAPRSARLRQQFLTFAREPAWLLMTVSIAVTIFLILYPVFWLFYGGFTFGKDGLESALTRLWSLPGLGRAFTNTFLIMLGTVPLAFAMALPLAWLTARTDMPMRGVVELAALLPFITPPLIGAVAWALLAAPRTGLLNVLGRELGATGPIFNIYSMGGVIFVMALYLSPFVFVTVKSVMERMDASLEDASLIAGGNLWKTTRNVILPLSMPAILSAAILVFTRALEEFAIPGILGTPSGIYTITTYIFYQAISYTPPRYEIAALMASFIMGLTGLALGLQAWILGGRQRFTTVSGKGQSPRRLRLGAWRYVALIYALIYIALAVVLPYAVLIYAAFIDVWGNAPTLQHLTLKHIGTTFAPELNVMSGFTNSLMLALSGATIATLLSFMASYAIVNSRPALGQPLELVTAIPLTMPGPVLAIAILWAYLNPPLMLYGTLWILLVSYVTHYIPYGVRTVTGSLRQISIEFERAAAVSGATRTASLRDIVIPLVRPGMLAGWMLMFVSMVRELSSSIFLFVPGTETVAVSLVELWQEARFSAVAVLSLALVAVSLLVLGTAKWLLGGSLARLER